MNREELSKRIARGMAADMGLYTYDYHRYLKKVSTLTPKAVKLLCHMLLESIAAGNTVQVRGFGTLSLRAYTALRQFHDPRTFEVFKAVSKPRVHFKMGKLMRQNLNKGAKAQ